METIRAQPDQLVIRTRVPAHVRLVLVLAALIAVAALVYWSYRHGAAEGDAELRRAQARVATLEKSLAQLRQRHDDVRVSMEKVERQLQIDKAAYAELRDQLQRANGQLAGLGNELKFYRSIISPEDGASGLRIQDFELDTTGSGNQFRYKLVLIQALKHNRDVDARVSFEVEGARAGSKATIRHPADGAAPIEVRFKYFQTLTGALELPPDFVPSAVTVTVTGKKKKDPTVARRYPWPAA